MSISIKQLGDEPDLADEVDRILIQFDDPSYMFSTCAGQITDCFDRKLASQRPRLLVYCCPDSQIGVAAKSEAARMNKAPPCWGAANMPLAAVYSPGNKVAIWHEALHLLGADDCYIEDDPYQKKPDCHIDGCIMEYNPPESTCEKSPFLCDKNVCLLQNLVRKVEQARKDKMDS